MVVDMLSFFVTVLRLVKAIYYASDDREFRALAFLMLVLLLCGSLFYSYAEEWNLLDALYFCTMTMTTIGYGDLAPTNEISKIFTMVYAFTSIGVFVSLVAKLAAAMLKPRNKT